MSDATIDGPSKLTKSEQFKTQNLEWSSNGHTLLASDRERFCIVLDVVEETDENAPVETSSGAEG